MTGRTWNASWQDCSKPWDIALGSRRKGRRGRDVIASPDALGLESPRIVVEVKHRKGAMRAPAIRSFIGGLRANDRGLYVSTGGFTREARYEADRSNVPMRLLDLDGFVRHYVDVYDKTDEETRDILPADTYLVACVEKTQPPNNTHRCLSRRCD